MRKLDLTLEEFNALMRAVEDIFAKYRYMDDEERELLDKEYTSIEYSSDIFKSETLFKEAVSLYNLGVIKK